jgi:hypothetical protein
MPTIRELLKKNETDLYGLSGTALIESKGLVNAPRQVALLASSPNALGDLIGNQIGGAFGGNPNRPSDTIFKGNGVFNKPVTLAKTNAQIKDAVEPDTMYYVKPAPAPGSIIAKLKQGATSPMGMATSAAIGALQTFGSKKGISKLKAYKDSLKFKKDSDEGYGYHAKMTGGNSKGYTKYAPVYSKMTGINGNEIWVQTGIKERFGLDTRTFDDRSDLILKSDNANKIISEDDAKDLEKSPTPYIKIKVLGEDNPMFFNATITNFTEDLQPDIQTYKFIGSPFNNYIYNGVERTIKLDFKLYYLDEESKNSMLVKLNYLTKLVYPFENLVETKYDKSKESSQLIFSPNFIELSIKSMYKDILGIVDNMSFTIDDNVAWNTFQGTDSTEMIPSVINVSMGMKVINSKNNFNIKDNKVFRYNFRNQDAVAKWQDAKDSDKKASSLPMTDDSELTFL